MSALLPQVPTSVGVGTSVTGTGTLTPSWPASVAVNDVALLVVCSQNEAISLSTANGFTQIGTQQSVAGTSPVALAVFWCRASSTSPASPVVAANVLFKYARIYTFRGCSRDGNPYDVVGAGVNNATGSTSLVVTGATALQQQELVVPIVAYDVGSNTPQLSGWTNSNLVNLFELGDESNVLGGGIGVAAGNLAAGGAYGNTTVTAASSTECACMSIALKPAWTVDAAGKKAFPAGVNEWADFCAAILASYGVTVPAPALLWLCQDPSGNASEQIVGSSGALTATNTPLYNQAITGHTRTGFGFTAGSGMRFIKAASPILNAATSSITTLAACLVNTAPTAIEPLFIHAGNATASFINAVNPSPGIVRITNGANSRTGTANPFDSTLRPFLAKHDITNSVCKLYTDQETVAATFAALSGIGIWLGGNSTNAAGEVIGYVVQWQNGNAEMSDTQVSTLLYSMGWSPAWAPGPPTLVGSFYGEVPDYSIVGAARHPAFGYDDRVAAPIFPGTPGSTPTLAREFFGASPDFSQVLWRHPAFASHMADIPRVPIGPSVLEPAFYGRMPDYSAQTKHSAFALEDRVAAPIFPGPVAQPTLVGAFYGDAPDYSSVQAKHAAYERQSRVADVPRVVIAGPATLVSEVVRVPPRFEHANGRDSRHPGYRSGVLEPITAGITPARGGAMAYVFTFDPESGAVVTYSWATDMNQRSRNGLERRVSLRSTPREAYTFQAYLDDAALAALAPQLVAQQATAKLFGVALAHESLPIAAPSSGSTAIVPTTGFSDWCYAGQTALVQGPDLSTGLFVVQGSTSTTIALDKSLGSLGVVGARIMPVIPCYLDDAQGFALYVANAGRYNLKARASYFGNASGGWSPAGATIKTATFSIGTVPIWEPSIAMGDDTSAPRGTIGGTELMDRGGALLLHGSAPVVDWSRQIVHRVYGDADRQYLKAFAGAVRGQQRIFGLPTWRPDLVVASGDASTSTLTVVGSTTNPALPDYAQWFNSPAHHFLMIVTPSGPSYCEVTEVVDNHDGTETLQLDRGIVGAISLVSLLEICRFATDDVPIAYTVDGVTDDADVTSMDVGQSVIPCQVVQR